MSLSPPQHVCDKLLNNREMIAEYFNLVFTEDGVVEGIPMLLPGYTPGMDRLPTLVLRLALEVGPGAQQAVGPRH